VRKLAALLLSRALGSSRATCSELSLVFMDDAGIRPLKEKYFGIAEATDGDKAGLIWAELRDRYGQPPEAVASLIEFSVLKCLAQKLGIESIDRRQGRRRP
jgi:transcription-repair coupling factor (superfamily II helicase)